MESNLTNVEELKEKVDNALESIRPYLKADGGDVKIVDISEDNVLSIELLGSCESCPMSSMTFKAGIVETIKKEVPEITSVVAVNI